MAGQLHGRSLVLRVSAASFLIGYVLIRFVYITAVLGEFGPTLLDEALTVAISPFAALALLRSFPAVGPTFLFFLVYAFLGLVSAVLTPLGGVPQPLAALHDIILDAKLLVVFLGFFALFSRAHDPEVTLQTALRFVMILALINAPFVLRDFLLGAGTGLRGQRLLPRMGFYQAQGLFWHHSESMWMSYIGALSALYFLRQKRTLLLAISAIILVTATFIHLSTKESVALVICIGLMFIGRLRNPRTIVLGVPLLAMGMLAAWYLTPLGQLVESQLSSYLGAGAEDMARTVMSVQSMAIAQDFFPLGSGAGTFASPASYQLGYSEIYFRYGISTIWGASPETANFLTDVFWPKALAQGGVFALLAFIGFIWTLCKPALRSFLATGTPDAAFCVSVALSILIISSAATPFSQELLFVFFAFSAAYGAVRFKSKVGQISKLGKANSKAP